MKLANLRFSQFHPADLTSLLSDMISLLDSQASLINVKFHTVFNSDVPLLVCEANQLKQVFINVIKNSIEAMQENGGTIKVMLEYERANETVIIKVIDQGRGIAEEDMIRLGEPFYTSKSSGNGLGLMVSQRIIATHKGTMNITSKLGEGTCVEIRLPAKG